MTSSSQNPTPLDDLRADASATVATEQDLLAWIPKAALLAALGAPQPLANFPAHLTHLALDDAKWQTLLKERLQEAAWDFRHALGEDLGHAHLDAQEWHYAYQLIPTTTDRNWSMEEVRLFEAWAEDACDHNLLDQEAQAAILNWRETWPVAEEGLLSTVRTPLTEGERWVGAELMRMQGERKKEAGVAGKIGGADRPMAYSFPSRVNRPAMAAAGMNEHLEECAELRFASPNGQYEASIFLPRYTQDGSDALRLEIYATSNNGDASALNGTKVALAIGQQNSNAVLDKDAQALLLFTHKIEGQQELELVIQNESWTFIKAVSF